MCVQSGALFDSLSVAENVAFPLRERRGLEEDQIQKICERTAGDGWSDLGETDCCPPTCRRG